MLDSVHVYAQVPSIVFIYICKTVRLILSRQATWTCNHEHWSVLSYAWPSVYIPWTSWFTTVTRTPKAPKVPKATTYHLNINRLQQEKQIKIRITLHRMGKGIDQQSHPIWRSNDIQQIMNNFRNELLLYIYIYMLKNMHVRGTSI